MAIKLKSLRQSPESSDGFRLLTRPEYTPRYEFALMTAAYILVCLTQEGKSIKDIAKDFDNNLELVTVWIDYIAGINWIYKDGNKKWIATNNGKK
jgi:hypothetical protein